jgi:hypothetical protein
VPFGSILFDRPTQIDGAVEPPSFGDLNLDQMLESVDKGREEYELKPFFYTPLTDAASIRYRLEVLRDLEQEEVFEAVRSFAENMRRMRAYLTSADKSYYRRERERWLLDAADIYCGVVGSLAGLLDREEVGSPGFRELAKYLARYVGSAGFQELVADKGGVKQSLGAIVYSVQARSNHVTVSRYAGETDYSTEVENSFRKFQEGAVSDQLIAPPEWAHMNHVQAQILEGVAHLYPGAFRALDEFCERHQDFVDPVIARFDREVQFYLAYLAYIDPLKRAGLPFCYPHLSSREADVRGAFDIALAERFIGDRKPVVRNDFRLEADERIIVVTGPNQGGKTTFARMFGQLHYLASLGLLVPGEQAQLPIPDGVFTHFEREEHAADLRSRLEEQLVRIHAILQKASSRSVIIMNESLTATTLEDARALGRAVLGHMTELGALGVLVTFVDDLALLVPNIVSMVSTVRPEDPSIRTFEIVRKPADGIAYAGAIAEKYGLDYSALRERLSR